MDVDGRRWTPVQKNVTPVHGKDFTIEFIPTGQNVNDWKEMVTVQFFAFIHPQPATGGESTKTAKVAADQSATGKESAPGNQGANTEQASTDNRAANINPADALPIASDITVERFETAFLNALQQGAAASAKNKQGERTYEFPPNTPIVSKTISKSNDSVLFEWEAGRNGDAQQELVRVIKGTAGLDVVHYTTKSAMTPEESAKWQKLLNEAHLENIGHQPAR